MKRTKIILFVGILFFLFFFFTRCEEEETKTEDTLPIENSTEIIGTKNSYSNQKNRSGKYKETSTPAFSDRLTFTNKEGSKYTLKIEEGELLPDPQSNPILLINLFDINERASMAQIPYLTKLQETYGDRLTVLGIPTNQSMDEEELKAFISMHHINYFISYESNPEALSELFANLLEIDELTAPTTLLYHQGQADSVYEGAVPIEMITHDIVMISKE
ncbi:MAG: hypothetical protein JW682_04030 [Campylobacterales bacterium]|nr:hypothetical protein [Campylobacterales bacterium]HEO97915.1 hypothetical protein [Campylobacterota bacterium]